MKYIPEAKSDQEKAQRVIVGHIYNYPGVTEEILELVRDSDVEAFTHPALRRIFEAIRNLYDRGATISPETIVRETKNQKQNISGVTDILFDCSDAASREYRSRELGEGVGDYIRVLREGHLLIKLKADVATASTLRDAMGAMEKAAAVDAGPIDRFRRPTSELFEDLVESQIAIKEGRKEAGYEWGISALDESLPIKPGNVYVVGGTKGSSKTKFLTSTIVHNVEGKASDQLTPVLFFSMEMPDLDICKYLVSHSAKIDSSLILSKNLPDQELKDVEQHAKFLGQLPLEIDSSPSLTTRDVMSRIRHWKLKNKIPDDCGLVVIDFFQRLSFDRRRGEISEYSAMQEGAYDLARAAKTMGVAIVMAAQLNKGADGVRPEIGDIEGSGGSSQAAHGVLLLDLKRLRRDGGSRDEDFMDELDIIIAKSREGRSRVTIRCVVDLTTGWFFERTPRKEPAAV